MFRLAKYLKPFTILILIAIVLLFLQALANLALPDYMSNIVNFGIQQGGIKNAVPEAIRKNQMDKLIIFMDAESRSKVLESYTLFAMTSSDYREYLKKYPQIEYEGVYVLDKISREETERVNKHMGRAFLAIAAIEQMIAEPEKASAFGGMPGFDISKIPEDMSADQVLEMIRHLPEAQLSGLIDVMDEKFDALGDRMVTQSATSSVRAEYIALGMDMNRVQNSYIWHAGLLMLLLSLAAAICTVAVGYLSAKAAAGTARNLRDKVFTRIESFSNTEFDKFSTASLITRSTNDITQIQMLIIMLIRIVCYAPILGIGGIIRALGKSTSMSWIIALAVIVIICLIIVIFSVTMPRFRKMQDLIDRLSLVTRENLSGMMVIRAFNTQKFEEDRFDRANIDLTKTSLFVNRAMVILMPAMMLVMNGLSLLIVWVGAHQVAQSNIQVGDMMAFLQYAMLIIMSFLMLSMMFIMIPRASVSAGRVADVLETETVIRDPKKPGRFAAPFQGRIDFKNVSFSYPEAEEDVIHDISFTARPGQTTAIIGSTGSGKSTLANLLLRFYDVSRGQILIDGIDIREVTQYDLRDRIGYVPQRSILFSGTIESNLRYGNENASEQKIREAAKAAQSLDFIDEGPKGFNTRISQGGKNVSGGQKQRLSIARALVKDPGILVLDDCFSALDFKTDRNLRKALKEYSAKSTLFIIAQRVGTVMNAQQIIVLDEGKIAGRGTHGELMESCNTYREIALSQLSKEELA
ncbi:MAG: ABC transporter ATP-binding protein/permease [Actinomycetia bacterium]|nr:ABC transporter ATP-binding protein/permease [Actinomycetes bacterium]